MTVTEQRYSLEEVARLGEEVFDRIVQPQLRPEDDGKFVAIDVDSENYELDDNDLQAIKRLRLRCPAAQIMLLRAGQKGTCRLGFRR